MPAGTFEQNGSNARPKLLVCLGAAWPGNDASGPNRSFAAFCNAFSSEFDISLLARATPFGNAAPVPMARHWIARETHRVRYFPVAPFGAQEFLEVLRTTPHDILLLNGFFDREFTIPALLARAFRRIPSKPVILSPRGEFSNDALSLKRVRKAAWLAAARTTGMLRDVVIHATTEAERDNISAAKLSAKTIAVAPNLSPRIVPPPRSPPTHGVLRILFVGRLSPVKNHDFALAILAQVQTAIRFDIVGPAQDAEYSARCRAIAARLPPNIEVRWHGEISAQDIPKHLARADLFFLPSKSENFGHAILEALACGTPVLLGQNTPWRDLAADGAGDDLPLDQPDAFVRAIERFATRSIEEVSAASIAAGARAKLYLASNDAQARHRVMILDALGHQAC